MFVFAFIKLNCILHFLNLQIIKSFFSLKKITQNIFLLIFTGIIFLSCNPTRTLTEGEFLVNNNSIEIDNNKVSKEDVSSYIKQKPNRRILIFFRFHLGVYNISHSKKEHKLLKWLGVYKMGDIIGEPPVILDTLLTNKSVKQIKLYLNSKGYFNSIVNKEIHYKKKKANLKYIAHTSRPYIIKELKYSIKDDLVRSCVYGDTSNSLIIIGNNYDTDVLQSERERITTNLKNDGFYYFTKEFITYNIDSAFGNHQLEITLEVRNPLIKSNEYSDSLISVSHKRYRINDINIYPDYSSLELDSARYKKYSFFAAQRKKSSLPTVYNFLFKDTLKIKPKTITQSILFKRGDYYKMKDAEQTNNRLIDLKMFKFVNIEFLESKHDTSNKQNLLDCKIQMTRTPVQSVSVETEATNSAGNLGVGGNLIYQNKNVFRGAEIFKFNITGAMEIQKILGEKNNETGLQQYLPFNTIETGAEAGIDIPKFLIPVKQERFSKYFNPKTTITAGLNYQKRPDYTRYIINVSYGYNWKESQYQRLMFYPADINSVKIYPSDQFKNTISLINDPKIINSYNDHMTFAGKFNYIFSNQQLNMNKDFSYFRGNFESSGLILRGINKALNNYKFADGSYTVFYIKYAQYIKADADYRHYFIFNEFNKLVFRAICGYGQAYGNSTVLPFEKSFFAGGANSIRAWSIYSLGPGSFSSTNTLNRTGDIDIEGNMEYRFPIYSYLKGALFMDAGNIWLNKKNDKMTGGEFQFDRFYKEFAVAFGFGARFDFSYFILRLDAAVPARDPSNPDNRWVLDHDKFSDIHLNLGIGYPF